MTRDLLLAKLCEAIYEDWPEVRVRTAALGFTVRETWDHADTQGMLVDGPDFSTIVFRGTEASKLKLRDLVSNLGHPTGWMGTGLAHSGYVRHLDRIIIRVFDFARNVDPRIALYMTGHSLGGAIASLAASLYGTLQPDWKLAGLATFGAPKAMDKDAAAEILCPVARYTLPMDFAPWWPPSFRLTHPGHATRLKAQSWWPGPVSRHMISVYVEALEAA